MDYKIIIFIFNKEVICLDIADDRRCEEISIDGNSYMEFKTLKDLSQLGKYICDAYNVDELEEINAKTLIVSCEAKTGTIVELQKVIKGIEVISVIPLSKLMPLVAGSKSLLKYNESLCLSFNNLVYEVEPLIDGLWKVKKSAASSKMVKLTAQDFALVNKYFDCDKSFINVMLEMELYALAQNIEESMALKAEVIKAEIVLDEYIQEEIRQILKFEAEQVIEADRVSSFLSNSVSKAVSRGMGIQIPQELLEGCELAIEKAYVVADKMATKLTDEKDLLKKAKVSSIEELRSKDFKLSNKMANNVHNWALGFATIEGIATGIPGMVGAFADIPMIITAALRTIGKIGLCYGYRCDSPEFKEIQLQIMDLKTSGNLATKHLAIELAEKMVRKAIPIVGAAFGGAMNYKYLNEVAWSARRYFQKKWLQENGLWTEENL